MTSKPASRRARATTLAPRSCPSRPGFATTTRYRRSTGADTTGRRPSSQNPDVDVRREVEDWLDASWDPDLTLAEWWARLGASGWAVPSWPPPYGRGLAHREANRMVRVFL